MFSVKAAERGPPSLTAAAAASGDHVLATFRTPLPWRCREPRPSPDVLLSRRSCLNTQLFDRVAPETIRRSAVTLPHAAKKNVKTLHRWEKSTVEEKQADLIMMFA